LHGTGVAQIKQPMKATDTWSIVAAVVLAAFYLATSIYIASHRLLWIDEIVTVLSTRLPGWTTIWKAFAQGASPMPPTYFMAVRIFDNLFRAKRG